MVISYFNLQILFSIANIQIKPERNKVPHPLAVFNTKHHMLKYLTNTQFRFSYNLLNSLSFLSDTYKFYSIGFSKIRQELKTCESMDNINIFKQCFKIMENHKRNPIQMCKVLIFIHLILQSKRKKKEQLYQLFQQNIKDTLQNSKQYCRNIRSRQQQKYFKSNTKQDFKLNSPKSNILNNFFSDHSIPQQQSPYNTHVVADKHSVNQVKRQISKVLNKCSSANGLDSIQNKEENKDKDKKRPKFNSPNPVSNFTNFTNISNISTIGESINQNSPTYNQAYTGAYKQNMQMDKTYQISCSKEVVCKKIVQPYCAYILKYCSYTNTVDSSIFVPRKETMEKQQQFQEASTQLWHQINLIKMILNLSEGIQIITRYYKKQYFQFIVDLIQVIHFDIYSTFQTIKTLAQQKIQEVYMYYHQQIVKNRQDYKLKMASNINVSSSMEKYKSEKSKDSNPTSVNKNEKKVRIFNRKLQQVKQLLKQAEQINEKVQKIYRGKYFYKQLQARKIIMPKLITFYSVQYQQIDKIIKRQGKRDSRRSRDPNNNENELWSQIHQYTCSSISNSGASRIGQVDSNRITKKLSFDGCRSICKPGLMKFASYGNMTQIDTNTQHLSKCVEYQYEDQQTIYLQNEVREGGEQVSIDKRGQVMKRQYSKCELEQTALTKDTNNKTSMNICTKMCMSRNAGVHNQKQRALVNINIKFPNIPKSPNACSTNKILKAGF